MGRWSARHRKTAIFGWLAFVIAAVVIGGMVGTKQLEQDELGIREAGRAQEIIDGGYRDTADESVFVQSSSAKASDPAFRAVVGDVVEAVSAQKGVSNVRSPYEPGGATLVSKDGHAALVQFELDDTENTAPERVEPSLAAVDEVQERHDGYRVEQFGGASATKAAAATSGRAVLISGLTVIAALAGMFLGGTPIWTSIGLGTILFVAIAVAGSLTVLPARLSKLGDRVEKGRLPFVGRRRRSGGDPACGAPVLDGVLRRRPVSAAVSAGLLVVLALPALGMKTELTGVNDLPRSLEIMQTYDRRPPSRAGRCRRRWRWRPTT